MHIELTGAQALLLARMAIAKRDACQLRIDQLRGYADKSNPLYAGPKQHPFLVRQLPEREKEIDHWNAILEVLAPLADAYQDEIYAELIIRKPK